MHIILLGPPGGGKGTQASRIAKHYNISHICSGNIIRNAIKNNSDTKSQFESLLKKGQLIPDEVITQLIAEHLEQLNTTGILQKGCLFDGFPRTLEQAKKLDDIFTQYKIQINNAIHIQVPKEELTKRLLKRSAIENRSDDTQQVIQERITIYQKYIQPILDFYKQTKKLTEINGVGEVDDITNNILSIIHYLQPTNNIKSPSKPHKKH